VSDRTTRGWQFSRPATIAREATARLFGPALAWLLHGPATRGCEHLDAVTGPVIICPTHASHLDSSALRLALGPRHRRRLAPAVAADYFAASRRRWLAAAWFGAFPFDRSGHGGSASFAAAERLLESGWSVLIYPEGTRTRTGEIGPFRPGVGLLVVRTGRPVLPVRIVGTHRALPPGARLPRRVRAEVRFGPLLHVEPGEDPRRFTERLEAAVRAL
jgi:1-acyl-sn-glycerol-3-phosphate acyltransferase